MRSCPVAPIEETTECGEMEVSPSLNVDTVFLRMISPQFNLKLILIPPMVGE